MVGSDHDTVWLGTETRNDLKSTLVEIERIAGIAPTDDSYGSLAVRMNKIWLLARNHANH